MKFLSNLKGKAMTGGAAIAGGVVSRALVNKGIPMIPIVNKVPEKWRNLIPLALGAMAMDVKKMHYAGVGMVAVAGTDQIGKFLPFASATGIADDVLEVLAEEVADELEEGVYDDVSDPQEAMAGDDDEEYMAGDDDYEGVNDDVSSPGAAMNGF